MASLILNRKYKLSTSDKFDEYMKALGVGLVTRKMGNTVSPVVELTQDGDVYTLTSKSTFKNSEQKFTPGKETATTTPDGREVKSTFTIDGNKLIEVQKGDKDTTIVREFSNDEVKMVLTVDDIVCTRIYKPTD